MDRVEAASAVCELPIYLREHTNTSLAARREELFEAATTSVHERDLKAILMTRPALVEAWESSIEDQRTSDGWYVIVRDVLGGSPQWIVARPSCSEGTAFDSRVAAFAALIVRVVGEPLCASDSEC
jgi:hypothetical protein